MSARIVAFPARPREPEPWRGDVARRVRRHRVRRHWARVLSDVLDSPWPGLIALGVVALWVGAIVWHERIQGLAELAGATIVTVGTGLVIAAVAAFSRLSSPPSSRRHGRDGDA